MAYTMDQVRLSVAKDACTKQRLDRVRDSDFAVLDCAIGLVRQVEEDPTSSMVPERAKLLLAWLVNHTMGGTLFQGQALREADDG